MARRPKIPHTPEREQELFEQGLRLFNAGDFFEAHEVWEDAWWPAEDPMRLFLWGLIQVSVAFEQWRRRNPAGAVMLYRAALRKLEQVPPEFRGVDCAAVVRRFEQSFAPLLDTAPNARYDVRFRPRYLFTIERA